MSATLAFTDALPPNGARILCWHRNLRPSSPLSGEWWDNELHVFEGESGVFWPDHGEPLPLRRLERWMLIDNASTNDIATNQATK